MDPEVMLGLIIKEGFEDIAKVHKGWRVPNVNYVD